MTLLYVPRLKECPRKMLWRVFPFRHDINEREVVQVPWPVPQEGGIQAHPVLAISNPDYWVWFPAAPCAVSVQERPVAFSHNGKKKKKSSFSSIRNNLHRLNFERVSSEQKTNVKFNNSVKNNTVWLSAVLSLKHAPKKWLFKRGWCKGENFVFTNMFFHLLIKDFFLTIRAKGSVCSSFLHLQVQIKPWNNDFPLITLLGKV